MASWVSADGVVSLLLDDEFGSSEAESNERDLQESSTDMNETVFFFNILLQIFHYKQHFCKTLDFSL